MHEITFVKQIIDQIEDKDKVESIELEVGELAGIEADHLKEHIESITGWKVLVKEMPSNVKCQCGYIGRANIKERAHDILIYNCPKCSSLPEHVVGQDIKLKRVVYY
jgi:Zn finger protein HypA/HybF involved in hydrogenase expression